MGEIDVAFRYLLRGLPAAILRLVFPDRQLEPLGTIDPSADRPRQRTADSLFRVRDSDGEAAVHVEIEREWRPSLQVRMFEYASAVAMSTRLPVCSIVILLRPGGSPPDEVGIYRIRGIGSDTIVFRYHVVPLWQLDARSLRSRIGIEGAPFCVAMHGADEVLVRSLYQDVRSASGLNERERQTTVDLLYIVTAAILGSETATRIFDMETIIQDPNVQALRRKWEDKGRIEQARATLCKVLAVRSLEVTPDVQARIDGESDVALLDAWLEAAVTAKTIEEVFSPR